MLDLSRRNQLPERERAVCLKLLLRLTLKDEVFDEYERLQAQEWLSIIEGTRSRRNRTELYNAPDHRAGGGRGRGRGRGRGGRGGRGGAGASATSPEGEATRKRTGRWGNRFGKGVIGDGEKSEAGSSKKYPKTDNSDDEEVNSNSDDEFVSSGASKRKSGGGRGGGRGGRGGGRGRGRGRGAGSNDDLASAASSAVKSSTGKRRRASQYSDEDGEGEGEDYLSDAAVDINSDNSDREVSCILIIEFQLLSILLTLYDQRYFTGAEWWPRWPWARSRWCRQRSRAWSRQRRPGPGVFSIHCGGPFECFRR